MIYFVQPKAGGHVKIGTTVCLSLRLSALESEYDREHVVLGVMTGARQEESVLHHRFSHLRQSGEWFDPAPELIDCITTEAVPWDGVDEIPPPTRFTVDAPENVRRALYICAARLNISVGEVIERLVKGTLKGIPEDLQIAERAIAEGEPAPKRGGRPKSG